jgi:hypothetical protein
MQEPSDNLKRECGNGKTYRIRGSFAKDTDCKARCEAYTDPRATAQDKKLHVRLCTTKTFPPLAEDHTLHIAFPTTTNVATSETKEFKITRAPYQRLHRRSHEIGSCLEAEAVQTEKAWSPALEAMVAGVKAMATHTRVPFAFDPDQLSKSTAGKTPKELEVDVDCRDYVSEPTPTPDDEKTKGAWCSCSTDAKPFRSENDCLSEVPRRKELCQWFPVSNHCGLKH